MYFGVAIIVKGFDAHSKESDEGAILVGVCTCEAPGARSVVTNLNSSKGTVEYAASQSVLRGTGDIRENSIASSHSELFSDEILQPSLYSFASLLCNCSTAKMIASVFV